MKESEEMRTRRRSDAWIAMETALDAVRFAAVKSIAGFGDGADGAGCEGCTPDDATLAQILSDCERMAAERAAYNRRCVARHRRCNITSNITEKCNITKEKGREREQRKENIPPTPPIREKREEKGKGKETLHAGPFGHTHGTSSGGGIYNNKYTCNNNNAHVRTREAEGDPMMRGPAMVTVSPAGRMVPPLADVERWAADAATKPGGRPIDAEFAREWYAIMEMASPPWTDMHGRDVSHDWRRALWWAWKEERRRERRGASGASGGNAHNQPEGVVLRQEGYDLSWMNGEGA